MLQIEKVDFTGFYECKNSQKERFIHDSATGTGTLLIEASYLASKRAPGLTRNFVMESWNQVNKNSCLQLRQEARTIFQPENIPSISSSDIDPETLILCRKHIQQAGLNKKIAVFEQDVRKQYLDNPNTFFVTNPPYGERIGDKKKATLLAASLGDLLRRHPGSKMGAITADPSFERSARKSASKRRRLYNGRLECEYLIFFIEILLKHNKKGFIRLLFLLP